MPEAGNVLAKVSECLVQGMTKRMYLVILSFMMKWQETMNQTVKYESNLDDMEMTVPN